jgi:hypothetical protein
MPRREFVAVVARLVKEVAPVGPWVFDPDLSVTG